MAATATPLNSDKEVRLPLVKLLFDKVLAILLLVTTTPLSLAISLAIKVDGLLRDEDRGPVFYLEQRVSQGQTFDLLKFRIFKVESIKQIGKGKTTKEVENEPENLTRIGKGLKKFGLDEIPQFVNILRGEMSFVGPRPKPVPEYEAELAQGIYRRRIIRAGLSGPVQIMKGTRRSFDDELAGDLDYINQCRTLPAWRLLLVDLGILGRTVRVLLKGTGE